MARIACVLKSGGIYKPEHVQTLQSQCNRDIDFLCLSDVPVPCERIALHHNWPGWFSKMELFRPDITGDLLFIDLDTWVVGDLKPFFVSKPTMLRDFYRENGLGSGFMFWPERARAGIWEKWIKNPDTTQKHGDQGFLERTGKNILRWQDTHPGKIISYKRHVRRRQRPSETGDGTIPIDAHVVCFHGKPRPWEVENVAA